MGTGGSIIGNGQFFKDRNKHTEVIMMQSDQNAYIQGIRNFLKARDKVLLEKNISLVDRMVNLSEKDAENGVRFLMDHYELLVGFSAGGNFSGAMKIAEEHPGSSVLTVFPDSGEKYKDLYLSKNITSEDEFKTLSRKIHTVRNDFITIQH
jgi:Cysteine synthase